jgi:putative transposase
LNNRYRRSARLRGYDYAQCGIYFVTICTHNRECRLGTVIEGEAYLSDIGVVAHRCWGKLVDHYPNIQLDAYIVMPNHIHGLIVIDSIDLVGAGLRPALTKQHGLSEIVRAFKSFSSREINRLRGTEGGSIWQRSFYDHIVRDEKALHNIRSYIYMNPERWLQDRENPLNLK